MPSGSKLYDMLGLNPARETATSDADILAIASEGLREDAAQEGSTKDKPRKGKAKNG